MTGLSGAPGAPILRGHPQNFVFVITLLLLLLPQKYGSLSRAPWFSRRVLCVCLYLSVFPSFFACLLSFAFLFSCFVVSLCVCFVFFCSVLFRFVELSCFVCLFVCLIVCLLACLLVCLCLV